MGSNVHRGKKGTSWIQLFWVISLLYAKFVLVSIVGKAVSRRKEVSKEMAENNTSQNTLPQPPLSSLPEPGGTNKRRKLLKQLLLIGIGAFVVIVLVSAITDSGKQSKEQGTSIESIRDTEQNTSIESIGDTKREPQVPKKGPIVHGIGETVPCGEGLELVVHKAYRGTSGNRFTRPKPGNYYLVVELELRNTGSTVEESILVISRMSLKDESGREYEPALMVPDLYTFPTGSVAPGEKARGTVPFEVPTSVASGLVLKFDPLFGDPVFVALPSL
jgi:hypothetical protein